MSRIAVTQKGRLLQAEIYKEIEENSFSIKQRDTASYLSIPENIINTRTIRKDLSKKKFDQLQSKYLSINETIKKDLEPIEDQSVFTASLNTDYTNNRYIRNKFTKLANCISKTNITPRKTEPHSIHLPPIAGSGGFVNTQNSNYMDLNNSSSSIRGSIQILADLTDKYPLNPDPRIAYYQGSVTRLVERHVAHKKDMLRTAKRILKNYDNRIHAASVDIIKPVSLLDSVKEHNPEAVDVLLRKTHSKLRKSKRLATYLDNKYKPYQDKLRNMLTKRFTAQIETAHQKRMQDNSQEY